MMRLFCVLVLLSIVPFTTIAGEVLVYQGEQTIFEDTIWDGDVLIDGILTVAAGTTLEIRPGSKIRFTRFDSNSDGIGEHEIFSQGRIVVVGTATEPVLSPQQKTTLDPVTGGRLT